MTLLATYNLPASNWTAAINAALAKLSHVISGPDINLRITLSLVEKTGRLAVCIPMSTVRIGSIGGKEIAISSAAAKFQGWSSPAEDFKILIDTSYPWYFGSGAVPGSYSAITVMVHELIHGLVMNASPAYSTPYEIWRNKQPAQKFDGMGDVHLSDGNALMQASIPKGVTREITAADIQVMQAAGIPTAGEDRIWLIPGGVYSGGADDTVIWCGRFDAYNARVSGPTTIEMPGNAALNSRQQDIYRLYKAAFGRHPDYAGFRYWSTSGQPFERLAAIFEDSPEAQATFASGSHEEYIAKLYKNVLGRAGEVAGLAYWNTRTDLSKVQLLCHFALSAENEIGTPTFTL